MGNRGVDVIAKLHDREQVELVNHKAWNGILHALVDSIADRTGEEIGQQLLLLAYMPAIHKAYAEVCQQFPALPRWLFLPPRLFRFFATKWFGIRSLSCDETCARCATRLTTGAHRTQTLYFLFVPASFLRWRGSGKAAGC
jgi:hypothetical protein